MQKARISAIAGIGKTSRAIGKDGKLLWRVSEDQQFFKNTTMGHPVIMGRKTWESIPAKFRPLPGRMNIVVTRNPEYSAEGAIVAGSVDEAISIAGKSDQEEIFIIGGEEIYRKALPRTGRLYLTLFESDAPGDAFFPEYSEFKTVVEELPGKSDNPPHRYVTLDR